MKEAKQMVEESDIKYDEAARKLAMVSDSSVTNKKLPNVYKVAPKSVKVAQNDFNRKNCIKMWMIWAK